MAILKNVKQTATVPQTQTYSILPSGALNMIKPDNTTATDEASCCTVELILMKLPLSLGFTAAVTNVIAGTKREPKQMKNIVVQGMTNQKLNEGKTVIVKMGMTDI